MTFLLENITRDGILAEKNKIIFKLSVRKLQLAIKYLIDFTAAAVGLILCSPIMLVLALAIKLASKGPIFFCQERLGKDARIFRLYKFRTMIPGAVNLGAGLATKENDSRITAVGSFLRKSSLDELPQLLNVLKGDISLVGPRPTVPEQLEYYGPFERRRLEMRPGITGLATIRGRASIPWSKRIQYDVQYIDNFNLWLDLKILLKTIIVVLRGEGTYYDYEKYGPAFDLSKPSKSSAEIKESQANAKN
ncbi:MAG: hypothetical protein AMJ79_00870 [Phycisphaerae bacterium SM23_30]|nr:MAG: hypothetical protein AMJ79_00870 [Phycisphaerae bacterium SM23_30]